MVLNTLRDLCKGLQISRSTIRWFDHNDLKSLEDRDVLLTVKKERPKRHGSLTRRFTITEVELKLESIVSSAMRASPLAQWDEPDELLQNYIMSPYVSLFVVCWLNLTAQDTRIDMIVGSVANGLNSGGFCTGSHIVVDRQCINGTSFVFSAAVPALLTVSASERINLLRNTPSILTIAIPSHAALPIIHIRLRSSAPAATVSAKPSNPATPAPREAPSFDIVGERLLHDIVDDAGTQAARAGAG
ncbi:hypothetical protein EDB83DRAFT_2679269 [Lactarius deliciosus]|nr:hypothetical protein EDB83DRAFT_2679269 [Lactarius deliciosus]